MDQEYRNRLGAFLKEYIDIKDSRYGYGADEVIKDGIKILITSKAFTVSELRKAAVKEQGIILTEDFIRSCLY